MAVPVIESSSTNTALAASSLVMTKPTGLAVGDLLVFLAAASDAGGVNAIWNTLSGWTSLQIGSTALAARMNAQYIVATSTEVAASNFTFTTTVTTTSLTGYLVRISGQIASGFIQSEMDRADGAVTTPVATTALTPTSPNSLLLFCYAGIGTAFSPGPTVSGYASTPSATWTEQADINAVNGSQDGNVFGVASASYTSLTQITSRTATFSQSANLGYGSVAIVVAGSYDQTGTNSLLSVSPTLFAPTVSAGTTGTNTLLDVSPTHFNQSGTATAPTQWSNEAKPSTTWTNET